MPVNKAQVSSTICPDDRQRDTCRPAETETRVTSCSTETQTGMDKDVESDILFRPIGGLDGRGLSADLPPGVLTKVTRPTGPLNSETSTLICLDRISYGYSNGCQNNSACDSSKSSGSSEGSSDKLIPDTDIAANTSPEVCIPIRSTTPDSTQSASTSILNPQTCSYVELFKARRKLEEKTKKYLSSREHCPKVGHQDTTVYPLGTMTETSSKTLVDTYKGHTTMCIRGLKHREVGLRQVSSNRGYPKWSGPITPSHKTEPRRRTSNNKYCLSEMEVSKGYDSSQRSQRKLCKSVTVQEEGALPSSIGHVNQGYAELDSDTVTGSMHRDLLAQTGRRSGINKVSLSKDRPKSNTAQSTFCLDPELVKIYGGTKQTSWNSHKSQRKKQKLPNFSDRSNYFSHGQKASGKNLGDISESTQHESYNSGRDHTKSPTYTNDIGKRCAPEAIPNDHELNMKETPSVKRREYSVFRCAINGRHGLLKPSSPLLEQETEVTRGTGRPLVATDVMRNIFLKGILKSPTETSRNSESSPADNSCLENAAARRVRFEERDFAGNSDKTLEYGTVSGRCDRTHVGHTNVKPEEQTNVNFIQSHNTKTEHYLKSSGFATTSSLHLGDAATIERNLPIIQHFRNVGDYDELYPGNGEATRWNGVCIDLKPLETKTSADINTGGFASRPFVSRQTAPDSARSASSNLSNAESDGRASGDGCIRHGTHNDRGNEDDNLHCQYSCFMADDSDLQTSIYREPISRELRSTSLETSQRQQKAIENLERALQQGVLHASLSNMPMRYKGGSTLRHTRNCNEGHVDLIDLKALDERVCTPRREVPPPPCIRYRSMYDYASKNNGAVCSVDETRTLTISYPLLAQPIQFKLKPIETQHPNLL